MTLQREPLLFLPMREGELLEGDAAGASVVYATRVTLRRNLAGHRYCGVAKGEELEAIRKRLRRVLMEAGGKTCRRRWRNGEWREMGRARGLVTREMELHWEAAEAFLFDAHLAALVNGEDHLLLRSTWRGEAFLAAWGAVRDLDEVVSGGIEYAFSPEFGHLTGSPERAGTGLCAEACLFLPGIRFLQRCYPEVWEQVFRGLRACGAEARDFEGGGAFIRVGNANTPGKTEEELVGGMASTVGVLCGLEGAARAAIFADKELRLFWDDRHARARAAARAAVVMDAAEEADLLSWLRWGTLQGIGLLPVDLTDLVLARDQPGVWSLGDQETPVRARRLSLLAETFSEEHLAGLTGLFRRRKSVGKKSGVGGGGGVGGSGGGGKA